MKNSILSLLACVAVVVVIFLTGGGDTGMFLDTPKSNRSFWHGCLVAITMIAGIFAGRLHSNISKSRRFDPRKAFTTFWRDKELWKSLLTSPIIFGVIYALLAETHDLVMAVVFSFQNGFFCNVIFDKKQSGSAPEAVAVENR
jgi:hypothetical protein